jgi:hypothetical protein
MSPQQDQSPGLHLPQPSFDVGQAPAGVPGQYQQPGPMPGIGAPMAGPAPAPQAQPYTPASSMPAMPQAMPTAAPQQAQPAGAISVPPAEVPGQPFGAAPASVPDAAAVQADDESSVDQEWITKARDIVAKTHSDPYLLSQEISKIKAQYIKVRYNKDIKTVDE